LSHASVDELDAYTAMLVKGVAETKRREADRRRTRADPVRVALSAV
jgi:hypothetical protein